jgi:hypothetical protein
MDPDSSIGVLTPGLISQKASENPPASQQIVAAIFKNHPTMLASLHCKLYNVKLKMNVQSNRPN